MTENEKLRIADLLIARVADGVSQARERLAACAPQLTPEELEAGLADVYRRARERGWTGE